MSNCEICGEPMPEGEEMFKYHGFSGKCPRSPTREWLGRSLKEQMIIVANHEAKMAIEEIKKGAGIK